MTTDNEKTTWLLGVDVGGTFTDLVAMGSRGEMEFTKSPSTADQSDGVLDAIAKIATKIGRTSQELLGTTRLIVHGTTVATNALLEYRGAKVGLLTTEGFRDEIEFRRSYKESTFNPRLKAPHAICPRRLRVGIPERLDHTGAVLTPLDEAAVLRAIEAFKEQGVEAVAICFLFSFLNPAHEKRVAELVRQKMPKAFVRF